MAGAKVICAYTMENSDVGCLMYQMYYLGKTCFMEQVDMSKSLYI